MASWSSYVLENPYIVFQKAHAAVAAQGFQVTVNVPGQSLSAVGGRSFALWLLILLVVLFWPAAIIYYFTRKKNFVTIGVQEAGGGTYLSINTEGEKADQTIALVTIGLTPIVASPQRAPPGPPAVPSVAGAEALPPMASPAPTTQGVAPGLTGQVAIIACRNCGTPNSTGQAYCTRCGAKLA